VRGWEKLHAVVDKIGYPDRWREIAKIGKPVSIAASGA